MTKRILFPREVLLVEVERWCGDPLCNARTRLALTKEEARAYTGFECARCERWNEDALAERDIPEWWEELKITSLEGVRPASRDAGAGGEPDEVVARLSGAWKSLGGGAEAEGRTTEEGAGDES